MKRLKVFVVVFFVFLDLQSVETLEDSLQYYGFVGCVFSPALCHSDEDCINDGLFGSCQRSSENHQDYYRYRLSRSQLVELEEVLYRLASSGYTWRHLYTQCRVMSTLLSYRYDVRLRNDFCKQGQRKAEAKNAEPDNSSTNQLIDDLIDLLSAKISLIDKEESSTVDVKRYRNQNGEPSTMSYDNAFDRRSAEMFEKMLNRLSESDVQALKDFLVQQHHGFDDAGKEITKNYTDETHAATESNFVVKKADASESGTITKVVIHYDPEAQKPSEEEKSTKYPEFPEKDIIVYEETSPSVGTVWSAVPEAVDGLGLQSQSVIRSVSTTEALPVKGRLLEQATHLDEEFNKTLVQSPEATYYAKADSSAAMIAVYILCALLVVLVVAAVAIVMVRHNSQLKEKLLMAAEDERGTDNNDATDDLQDLCRENMRKKLDDDAPCATSSNPAVASLLSSASSKSAVHKNSVTRSGDPVTSHMDISTGHMVLSYMEDHLANKSKLDEDWRLLCSYDVEPGSITAALDPANRRKNRCNDVLPYDQTRVRLNPVANVNSSDYINASIIMDDDPRCPAYIAAQGPLPNTVADFWQMLWEQGSTTIVCLTTCTLVENDVGVCFRYWPTDGLDLYHIYEVKLFEEHRQKQNDFVIRNFCLRNTETNETRTVTQFHYLSWPSLGVPSSVETFKDFRRKVNSSYHGRFCPIVVHCSDGAGQTGAYCLIDMVLNRIDKGAREMDIAATLEHIRDQRPNMVRTKEQFEFCLMAIAYEVENLLSITATK